MLVQGAVASSPDRDLPSSTHHLNMTLPLYTDHLNALLRESQYVVGEVDLDFIRSPITHLQSQGSEESSDLLPYKHFETDPQQHSVEKDPPSSHTRRQASDPWGWDLYTGDYNSYWATREMCSLIHRQKAGRRPHSPSRLESHSIPTCNTLFLSAS